jgi:hypothetical protein
MEGRRSSFLPMEAGELFAGIWSRRGILSWEVRMNYHARVIY